MYGYSAFVPLFRIMNLKYIFLGLFGITVLASCQSGNDTAEDIQLEMKVYRQAADMGDFLTASASLQKVLVLDSTRKEYLDTLANIYYTIRNYGAALKACQKWNAQYGPSENIMRIKGSTYEMTGEIDSAFEAYDKLYLMTPKTKYLFKTALFDLLIGREKGFEKLEKVRKSKELETDSVEIFWSEQNFMQYVKLNAALAWLDAAMMIKGGNVAGAKKALETANQLDPRFEMVRYYLQNMNKPNPGQNQR